MKLAAVALFAVLIVPTFARTSSHSKSSTKSSTGAKSRAEARRSAKCQSCQRDAKGRIQRSSTAKHQFQRSHPCPSTGSTSGACRGYVIDHVQALKHGGKDAPENMQWQTKAEAKVKDRVED